MFEVQDVLLVPKIEKSQLDSNQQNKIEDIINQQATHLGPQTLKLS
jgi:hemin transport system permease protein